MTSFPVWRCYRRLGRLLVLLLLSVLTVLFLLLGGTEFLYRSQSDSDIDSRSNVQFLYWVLPTAPIGAMSVNFSETGNWTLLLPKDTIVREARCSGCTVEDGSIQRYIQKWTHDLDLHPQSPVSDELPRMAAALFALRNGAVSVLFTSDINSFGIARKRLILDNQPDGVKGIEYYGHNLTLDSFHFYHRAKVAPGNPCLYRIRKQMKPLWTVGIRCRAHDQPGIDTLTLVDEHAPPVFTPNPRFSIFDFSDSFFDYEGFWAMFLSFIPAGEASFAWGLWAQRLLLELGAEMALTSLPCPEVASVHTMPSSPSDKSQQVFSFTTSWVCPPAKSFYSCAISLAEELQSRMFVSLSDVTILTIWLQELRNSDYMEPQRREIVPRLHDLLLGCVIHSPALVTQRTAKTPRKFFPSIEPMCNGITKPQGVADPFQNYTLGNKNPVADIALVVIFYDASIYSNIQFLEDLYRKYFPVLIYCGPDSNMFQTFYKTFKKPLTYIEVPETKGFVAYECLSRAVMLNYDVNGYLEMADDVILNTWTLANVPRDRFWFQKDLRIASRHQQMMLDFALAYPFPWWPWTVHGQMWGAKAMAKVWNTFHLIQKSDNPGAKEIVSTFLETLKHNSGQPENFFYCSSDIFYVPALHRQAWSMLSSIFFSNNVFLDIAVPTLINGMDLTSNIVRMEGVYLWYNERANYPSHYRPFHQFFHPWKMGWIHRKDHANFMCYYILPHIVEDLVEK